MTSADISSIIEPLARLNSWCRLPYQKRLDMDEAKSYVYRYKMIAIGEAFRLGMTDLRLVRVPAKCIVCKGTGTYKWVDWYDEDHIEFDDCRKCGASGNVTLHFIETNIDGVRWHSPLPQWDRNIKMLTVKDWENAPETAAWTPNQEGLELSRWEFIQALSAVERVIAGGRLLHKRYTLHLGDFQWKGCAFCGAMLDTDGRLLYSSEHYRPGFRWRQPVCHPCIWSGRYLRFVPSWPHDWKGVFHSRQDCEPWREHVPLPDEACRPDAEEWLARRGIVIGAPPPEEYGYTPEGIFSKVIAVRGAEVHVELRDSRREGYGCQTSLPWAHFSGRERKLLAKTMETL